jgi:hypothetical protein
MHHTEGSVSAMMSLISWCGDCADDTTFDQVPGAAAHEFMCRECGAAVFAGDLWVDEPARHAAVA